MTKTEKLFAFIQSQSKENFIPFESKEPASTQGIAFDDLNRSPYKIKNSGRNSGK